MDDTSFSLRHNAKRAAERMIDAGSAPSIDFGLRTRDDGRFEIIWKCGEPDAIPIEDIPQQSYEEEYTEIDVAAEQREDEIDARIAEERLAEIEEHPERLISGAALEERLSTWSEEGSAAEPEAQSTEPFAGEDLWPPGTPVKIRASDNRRLTGTIVERVAPPHWRVQLDFAAPGATSIYDGSDLEAAGSPSKPWAASPKKAQPTPPASAKPSKPIEIDAAAPRGTMPEKPIITSKANPGYQKRFDYLAERAGAGDWAAVRDYEVKGVNSYAKMVKQYRDRLLAAHASAK